MIKVEHHESIRHTPSLVYAAGTDTSTWPSLEKLSLEARERLLTPGATIDAKLNELGQHLGVTCEVTELIPERRLVIEGDSSQAWLSLGLDFTPGDEAETTEVEAILQLELRSFILRRTLGKVAAHIAKSHIQHFAEGFKANVEKLPANYSSLKIPHAS